MDDRLKSLEQWRVQMGIRKSQMSELMGANSPQTYTNWLGRGSLPKDYFDIANAILNSKSVAEASKRLGIVGFGSARFRQISDAISKYDNGGAGELLSLFEQMEPARFLALVQSLLPEMPKDIRIAIARAALADLPDNSDKQ